MKRTQDFKLKRYFALVSAVGLCVVVVVLSLFYRHIAVTNMIEHENRADADLARAFANALWPEFAQFVRYASHIPNQELGQRDEITRLNQAVSQLIKGLNVVKVKIYNLDGLTVFSTDFSQIGDDKSSNPGFISAKAGIISSELTFREQFSAFEGEIVNRNLLSPYIPIRQHDDAPVEAVFEIYSDVTELIDDIARTQWQISAGVLVSLLLLYAFLSLVVRRAGRLIETQQADLHAHLNQLEQANQQVIAANSQLEARVDARTTELRHALEHAQAANVAKSQFLATMSHEIRTPMTGLLGFIELLLSSGLDNKQQALASTAQKCGDTLLKIINDILDFSKVESGKLLLEKTDFSLHKSIAEVADLLAVSARQKGLELETQLDASVPAVLRGDPGRLRQILTNLLDNAIKFTEQGKVSVNVKRVSDMAQADSSRINKAPTSCHLQFVVSDTGCGITPEHQQQLFQIFSQVDASFSRQHQGSGLGLAICKQLVQCMDGDIGVSSEPGHGSRFWFRVCFEIGQSIQDDAATLTDETRKILSFGCPAKHEKGVSPHLLLVEDDAVNQMVTGKVLRRH